MSSWALLLTLILPLAGCKVTTGDRTARKKKPGSSPRHKAEEQPGKGQTADPGFGLQVKKPTFKKGIGPVIFLDEAHSNFHTADGRYRPFVRFLQSDGYRVKRFKKKFTKKSLSKVRVLVIANALSPRNVNNWTLPIYPAFTEKEVKAVVEWVRGGSSLLLVADHMPLPAAAAPLARAFGIRFNNGFAMHKDPARRKGPILFTRSDGTLLDHPITSGRNPGEGVTAVATFTGQAFRADPDSGFQPLLTFGPDIISLMPKTAWKFTTKTRRIPVTGWYQGGVLESGNGRVAVFGEAAMFTAQVVGKKKRKVGMNAPEARQNPRFLRNLIYWLAVWIEDG
jgi:hypothetical protein